MAFSKNAGVPEEMEVSADANVKSSIKRSWAKFSERTSLQGIPYVNRTARWEKKLCWMLIFIVALAGSIAQVGIEMVHRVIRYSL